MIPTIEDLHDTFLISSNMPHTLGDSIYSLHEIDPSILQEGDCSSGLRSLIVIGAILAELFGVYLIAKRGICKRT